MSKRTHPLEDYGIGEDFENKDFSNNNQEQTPSIKNNDGFQTSGA